MNGRPDIAIGVIGCGTIAYWQHLRHLRRLHGVRIAGLADPSPEARDRAARLVDAPGFARAEDLLSLDGLDAVVIASPTGLHADQVQQACAADKHIYVEKPLAHDADALARVRACAAGARRELAVGYHLRFHPACRQLRKLLQSERVGGVRAIVSHFTESFEPAAVPEWRRRRRLGGGVLLDLATHHLDLYRWLLREDLAEVTVDARTRHLEQDSAWVRGSTGSGIDVQGYFAHDGSRAHGIAVHGTSGVLRLDLHSGRFTLQRNRRSGYGVRTRAVRSGAGGLLWRSRKRVQPSHDPSHGHAMRAFVNAIANPSQRHPDLATCDDGVMALQALLRVEDLASAGPA